MAPVDEWRIVNEPDAVIEEITTAIGTHKLHAVKFNTTLAYLESTHPWDDGPYRPFWEAAREHRLVLPRCRQCGNVWFPPYSSCPRCLSFDREWTDASGKGKVWGFIEMAQPYIASFQDDLPYNVALVELDDAPGVRIVTNVVDTPPEEIKIGMPVEVAWEEPHPGTVLPRFRRREVNE